MNPIADTIFQKANDEAIFNLYMYLIHKSPPKEHETFNSVVGALEADYKTKNHYNWTSKDIRKLKILRNYINKNPFIATSEINNPIHSGRGLTACSFKKPDGSISVTFRGTGNGEWIDNGEGLSGIPEENTYITYKNNGATIQRKTIPHDYATDQQVEALNWFYNIASKNNWNNLTDITVSGHSKGGNKAQFIAIHSDLVNECYTFDGQGFSPESLSSLKEQYGKEYENRRHKIRSFSADNDYVNVLGERLMPKTNIYYLKSKGGLHYLESLIDNNGKFYPQCEQGKLSAYVESVSEELMKLNPKTRQYAALGVMNIFQKYLGKGIPVNDDHVSVEKTIIGIAIATGAFLYRLHGIITDTP